MRFARAPRDLYAAAHLVELYAALLSADLHLAQYGVPMVEICLMVHSSATALVDEPRVSQ
jgi:hypothetical protein